MNTLSRLKSVVSCPIKEGEKLALHTSFKIGGPAKYFAVANSQEEIIELIKAASKLKLPYLILGSGTNILFSDNGFDGLVIKIQDQAIKILGEKMLCSAGVALSQAVDQAWSAGLSGLEWAAGIPGTIGGAVYGNAGAYGGDMACIVEAVEVFSRKKIKQINNKKCAFAYRASIFKKEGNRDVILTMTLRLQRGDKRKIKAKMAKIISQRKIKEDDYPSAGSVFKNIKLSEKELVDFSGRYPDFPEKFKMHKTIPTAWLIEQCGLKCKKIGGAMVSQKHAGRIINVGEAKAEDVIILVSVIKQKVRTNFNLQLMEEVEYKGF